MSNKDFYLDDIKTSLTDLYQTIATVYAIITDAVDKPAYVRTLVNEEVCKLGTLIGMITVDAVPNDLCFMSDLAVIENKTSALCLHYSITLGDTVVFLVVIIDGVEKNLKELDLHNGIFITNVMVAGSSNTVATIAGNLVSEMSDTLFKRVALVLDAVTTRMHLENLKLNVLDSRVLKRIAVLLDSSTIQPAKAI